VKVGDEPLEQGVEDLFENAPCGYLSTALDGTILKVNRTFEQLTGMNRDELLGKRRFQELLAPGGRIYHETHYAPLLRMQGQAKEIALEMVCADGSRLPVLVNSVVVGDAEGRPRAVRTTVFEARERRRYEEELLLARKREREIAQQLQNSMLTGEMPSGQGLEIGASYRPADSGMDIGGDWYDAFWVGEEKVGLVVGDVVGRGIEAAATMGQLRSATRALASTGLRPGRLLEALDSYAARHRVGGMSTVVYVEIELGTREIRLACAGHPPPVLAAAGVEPYLAWEGRSTPLDVHLKEDRTRPEASCRLDPDSLVLLYTDGVVERRQRSIDVGMDRLLEEVRAHRDEPSAALASSVLHALEADEHRDDACGLVARIA
jgi:sigma-B regulation protein RsbU (phosphoserine phosphatase)